MNGSMPFIAANSVSAVAARVRASLSCLFFSSKVPCKVPIKA